jgi:DNA phosphorothioation-associated putative methyltransferase
MQRAAIQRHKTAIRRGDFSWPVKCLLRDGLVGKGVTFFDYGCGRGEDVELLTAEGVACGGWDPAYRPDAPRQAADVVNLGYVLNVIEDPEERAATLKSAWALCRQLLAVSAQVLVAGRGKEPMEFGDGVLTGRGTFQKFYDQAELKSYLEAQLQVEAVPAGIGTFYLFRDEARQQQFLANRFRRREILPRRRIAELRLEETRQALEPLMEVVAQLGRLPDPAEFPGAQAVIERFGSLKRAFSAVQRLTDPETWEAIARRRREDLLVYLALARFRKRPAVSMLPLTPQRDMKAFFGAYSKACAEADELLFKAGDASAIDEACKRSTVGKLLPDDLYVHRESLDYLEPILRIYEGCGRAYLGEVEGANIIKIHRRTGKLSYLVYPDFEGDPHPALLRCVKLNLRTRRIECYDYSQSANPPVLHRKDSFLHPEHQLHAKFARLTAQEERHGLLDDPSGIGTRDGWARRLTEHGFALKGHRHEDGYALILGVLTSEQVRGARAAIDRLSPIHWDCTGVVDHYKCVFNREPGWLPYLDLPGIIDLAEAALGKDCHIIGQTAWRCHPGFIGVGVHADYLVMELPEEWLADPRFTLPMQIGEGGGRPDPPSWLRRHSPGPGPTS